LIFLGVVGKRAFDARSIMSITKSLGICGAVIAAHVALADRIGPWRLIVDGVIYLVLAVATNVFRPRDILGLLRLIKNRRQIQAEAEAAAAASSASSASSAAG